MSEHRKLFIAKKNNIHLFLRSVKMALQKSGRSFGVRDVTCMEMDAKSVCMLKHMIILVLPNFHP